MTLGGMIKHLAYVEDDWFGRWLFDLPRRAPWESVDWSADADWDWHSAKNDTPDGRSPSLRLILTHMIEKYARHNGHADLIRESIDGSVGE